MPFPTRILPAAPPSRSAPLSGPNLAQWDEALGRLQHHVESESNTPAKYSALGTNLVGTFSTLFHNAYRPGGCVRYLFRTYCAILG